MMNVCFQVEEYFNNECVYDKLWSTEELATIDYHSRLNDGLAGYEWNDHGEGDAIISLHTDSTEDGNYIRIMWRQIHLSA